MASFKNAWFGRLELAGDSASLFLIWLGLMSVPCILGTVPEAATDALSQRSVTPDVSSCELVAEFPVRPDFSVLVRLNRFYHQQLGHHLGYRAGISLYGLGTRVG